MRLDLIVRDANIVTLDERRPAARSLGVLHGRVVGLDEEIDGLRADRVLDAAGATVVPGFNDAHCHTTWYGMTLSQLDLSAARSPEEVHAAVERHAHGLPPDAWVVGAGLQNLPGGGRPHREALDRAGGGRPVWLKHTSGHLCYVSSEVLRRAGALEPGFAAPDGGVVARDADGRPDGLLEETAQSLVQDQVLPHSSETVADAVGAATRRYLAEGVTSFTEAGVGGGWIGQTPVELAAYQRASDTGRLHARAQVMIASDALHPLDGAHPDDGITTGLDLGLRTGLGDDRLSVGPVKIFLDGSLLGRTAAVTEPFCGCGHGTGSGSDSDSDSGSGSGGAAQERTGYFQNDPEAMAALVLAAHRAGWNVAAHAIGDRAVGLALDVYERAQHEHPRPGALHRVEHAGMVRPDQLRRFAALGVVPVPQHNFLPAFGDAMAANLGPERTGWTYRLRSFLDLGLTVPGSSDRPVAPGAPLPAMEAMVRRLTDSGSPFGPDERVTAEAALRAWTVGSAHATGAAASKGRLRPGMLADFAVLDGDPLRTDTDRIGAIGVLATAVGGVASHDPHSLVTVPEETA
ncbi:amidohydrolase [Streptomyces nanshensis]|uniref:Amidohydrolase 3 domain-containing protein n=1 Tax=Streptomyces nanshensis TaxID=518642 RepID=A0A1E7L5J7_9ACTN|nr:amidohydrolase [Streptomyces nanshensis]OEV11472.1 hypothetical protein AN218_12790 [Streptomyces nanshensis]